MFIGYMTERLVDAERSTLCVCVCLTDVNWVSMKKHAVSIMTLKSWVLCVHYSIMYYVGV